VGFNPELSDLGPIDDDSQPSITAPKPSQTRLSVAGCTHLRRMRYVSRQQPQEGDQRQGQRLQVPRTDSGGCGRVNVSGLPIEDYVFGLVLALAKVPSRSSHIEVAREENPAPVHDLVLNNSEDERTLQHLDDGFGDRRISRTAWLGQRKRIESRIAERSGRPAVIRGRDALVTLGKKPQEKWLTLSADEKRLITQSFVTSVRVFRAAIPSNRFDPDRVVIGWRREGVKR